MDIPLSIWIFLHVMGTFCQQVGGKHIPINIHNNKSDVPAILSATHSCATYTKFGHFSPWPYQHLSAINLITL